jgi:membrane protease YdiL (CAAX protease family)
MMSIRTSLSLIIPALRAFFALVLVLFFGEVVFRRWLGPAIGINIQNMADFTIWPEMLFFGFLFPACMVLVALGLYLLVDRRKWRDFGFSLDNRARLVAWLGFLFMLTGFGAFAALTHLSGIAVWRISPEITWPFVLSAAVAYIGTGVWEEIYFRGYFFRTLKDYGRVTAYIASISVFILIHFTEETFLLSRMLNLVLVSCFLTYVFDKTDSIWPGIILHGSWNLINFLLVGNQYSVSLLVVSGDLGEANRWLSNILHAFLLLMVWWVYRKPAEGGSDGGQEG